MQSTIKGFGLWRWFFFCAGLFPVYILGDRLVGTVLSILTPLLKTKQNALYLIVAVRVSACHELPFSSASANEFIEAHAAFTTHKLTLHALPQQQLLSSLHPQCTVNLMTGW